VLQQERQALVHLATLDDVEVVEHEHDVIADGVEVVDQGRNH
jgi:hypothetical protein